MQEFGALIRSARERKKLRSYDLAYSLGLTPSWVSKLERGDLTHPPAPNVLEGLTRCLGLSQVEMLEEIGYSVRDPNTSVISRGWTPDAREAARQLIETINAAMEEIYPTVVDDNDEAESEQLG